MTRGAGMSRGKPPTGRPHGGARKPKVEEQHLKIRLYQPHPGQWALHKSQARFRICVCGRRWGKTMGCANEVAKFAWENPGDETTNVSWWCAPTYNQSLKAMNLMANNFKPAISNVRRAVGQMMITWKNGSVTAFQSTERYDNLRGEGVTFMVLDEAAMMPRAAFQEVLRPMLSDTMGRCVMISTPRGKNWFYVMYQRGLDPNYPDYESFSFPTIQSPYIPDSEVLEAQATLPEDVFAQEYGGAFLDEAAGVFHGIEGCLYGALEDPIPGHRYVIGWDIAKSRDWSVVTVIDTDAVLVLKGEDSRSYDTRVPRVVAFDRFNSLRYDIQATRVEATWKRYGGYILLDSTGLGEPVYDMMQQKSIPCAPYVFTSRSKEMLIQSLAIAIQTKAINYPEIPVLQQELSAYQYQMSAAGRMQYSAPEGDHDDCVISLALANWAAQHPVWMQEPTFTYDYDEVISPI